MLIGEVALPVVLTAVLPISGALFAQRRCPRSLYRERIALNVAVNVFETTTSRSTASAASTCGAY